MTVVHACIIHVWRSAEIFLSLLIMKGKKIMGLEPYCAYNFRTFLGKLPIACGNVRKKIQQNKLKTVGRNTVGVKTLKLHDFLFTMETNNS